MFCLKRRCFITVSTLCLCVCEGSVFVGRLRKYFHSNGAQMLLTSQWCFWGELGPWWTHGLGLIYKLHFELLSPHIPKTSPLESRQTDKLITESGNRIEKAGGQMWQKNEDWCLDLMNLQTLQLLFGHFLHYWLLSWCNNSSNFSTRWIQNMPQCLYL